MGFYRATYIEVIRRLALFEVVSLTENGLDFSNAKFLF